MAMGTISAALSAMRRLNTTSATRLKGIHLDDDWRIPALRSAAADWPADLNTALTARTTGTVTGDTPVYVVFSDLCRARHKSDYAEPPVMPRSAPMPPRRRSHPSGIAA
jgi:hypothetical protein